MPVVQRHRLKLEVSAGVAASSEASQRLAVEEEVPHLYLQALRVAVEVAVAVLVYLWVGLGLQAQEQQVKEIMAVQLVQITIIPVEVVEVQALQVALPQHFNPGMVVQAGCTTFLEVLCTMPAEVEEAPSLTMLELEV